MCRCVMGAATALSECEGSGRCGSTGNGSDNQHVVGWCVWLGVRVGEAGHPSWPPSETMSLVPAQAPWQRSLQGWRLLCGGEEEVAATKATTMA